MAIEEKQIIVADAAADLIKNSVIAQFPLEDQIAVYRAAAAVLDFELARQLMVAQIHRGLTGR